MNGGDIPVKPSQVPNVGPLKSSSGSGSKEEVGVFAENNEWVVRGKKRETVQIEYISERFGTGGLGFKSNGVEYAKPFQFLNLGVLAYVGASQALAQVTVDKKNILGQGKTGFLLWRGIYWFKQVSWRNRLLVAVDWLKAQMFGRDLGSV